MNSFAVPAGVSAGVSAPEQASTPAGGDVVQPAVSRAWKIDWMVALILPVLLGIAWELAVRFGYASGRLMPPPSRLAVTALALIRSGELQTHIAATMTRVALGFLFGSIAGTAIGTLAGASAPMRRLLDPSIQALRAIPSIAWVPLFILWLGIFETSKLALVSLGVFFPVYLGVFSAIQDVDRKLLEVGRVFGLSPLAQVRRIILPAILPTWVAALRSGLGLGFMFVLAAELLGASEGLGYLLLDGQQMGRADSILVAMITFAILGKISDGVIVALARPVLRWQDTARTRL